MIIPFFLRLEIFRLFLFSMKISHKKNNWTNYTLENKHQTWKLPNWKGRSSCKPPSLGSKCCLFMGVSELSPTADVPRHLPRAIVWIPRWDPQPLMSVSYRRDPHNQAYLLGIGISVLVAGGFFFGEFIVFGVRCRCFHFPQTSQLLRRIQAHCAKLQLYSHVHLLHFPCKNSKEPLALCCHQKGTQLIENIWHIHGIHLFVAPYGGTLRHITTCGMLGAAHWWYV